MEIPEREAPSKPDRVLWRDWTEGNEVKGILELLSAKVRYK